MGWRFFTNTRWRTSPRIAAAVEAACLAPAVALLVLGLTAWGGHFWLERQVQWVANAAVAAAAEELDIDVRESRARAAAERALSALIHRPPADLHLSLVSQSKRLTVLVVYDASRSSLFGAGRLLPMPSPTIVREASRQIPEP